jgi:hypothetical protein
MSMSPLMRETKLFTLNGPVDPNTVGFIFEADREVVHVEYDKSIPGSP